MKKIKILSILLALILVVSTITVSAEGNVLSEYTVDGVRFLSVVKNDGTWFYAPDSDGTKTAKVIAYNGKDSEVAIPEEIDGYTIDEIEIWQNGYHTGGTDGFPVFENQIETLIIPKTIAEITNYSEASIRNHIQSDLDNLKQYIVDEKNPNYSSENGVLFNKDKTVLLSYPCNKEETEYVIPETVTKIWHSAFFRLTTINRQANEGEPHYISNLKKLTITKNVNTLGWLESIEGETILETVVFDNVKLQKSDFEKLFGYKEIVVYKDSAAHKYYKNYIAKQNLKNLPKLTVLDNPYIEKQEKTESKDTTSEKDTVKDNSSKTESVVSKPTESVITETTESGEDLTIGAAENNTDNATETKPEKSNKIWIIVVIAAVVLLAGGTAYWFIRKKKKA